MQLLLHPPSAIRHPPYVPMSAEARLAAKLAALGLQLPPAPEPKGVYKPLLVLGHLAYTSGHLPVEPSGGLVIGRLGAELETHLRAARPDHDAVGETARASGPGAVVGRRSV